MKKAAISFLLCAVLAPSISAAADPGFRTICRGANLPSYARLMAISIRSKLQADGIKYNSVSVRYTNVKRKLGRLSLDLTPGLVIGEGDSPSVTYNGSFPVPEACEVTAKMIIRINYPTNTKVLTSNEVVLPGTMLRWKAPITAESLD